jgi:hypothetical protein
MQESDMGRSCSPDVRMRSMYKDLDRNPERKRQHGRPVCRWKYAIKSDFKDII